MAAILDMVAILEKMENNEGLPHQLFLKVRTYLFIIFTWPKQVIRYDIVP